MAERFNPRARAGRDLNSPLYSVRKVRFQSTRPRGARPIDRDIGGAIVCFNPRARAGRDFA